MTRVLIVTGPSGAGKSTVTRKIAENSKGTWALISQDDIRDFVKAGYRRADVEWSEDTQKQWDVSIKICCDLVKRYQEANINCVVDIFAPPKEFKKWEKLLKDTGFRLIVLLPDVEKVVQRNANRENVMEEAKVRENHDWFTDWEGKGVMIIDTSTHTLEETIQEVNRLS